MQSPSCGASDERGKQYEKVYNLRLFISQILNTRALVILDVGGHKDESVDFFLQICPESIIHSYEPDPDKYEPLKLISMSHIKVFSHNLAVAEKSGSIKYYKRELTHLGGVDAN